MCGIGAQQTKHYRRPSSYTSVRPCCNTRGRLASSVGGLFDFFYLGFTGDDQIFGGHYAIGCSSASWRRRSIVDSRSHDGRRPGRDGSREGPQHYQSSDRCCKTVSNPDYTVTINLTLFSMRARNVLLTHFSSRYPTMPRYFASPTRDDADDQPTVALAMDHACMHVGDIWKMATYIPAIAQSFEDIAEEGDEEEEAALVRASMNE